MIFQSRCYPIHSYLSPIRSCFRPNILAKINFKNSKATFASMKSINEQNSFAKYINQKIHEYTKSDSMLYFNFLVDICHPIRLFDPIR